MPALLLALGLALPWQPVAPGVWHREIRMADDGPLSAVRVIAIRLDPVQVTFALDSATRDYETRGLGHRTGSHLVRTPR